MSLFRLNSASGRPPGRQVLRTTVLLFVLAANSPAEEMWVAPSYAPYPYTVPAAQRPPYRATAFTFGVPSGFVRLHGAKLVIAPTEQTSFRVRRRAPFLSNDPEGTFRYEMHLWIARHGAPLDVPTKSLTGETRTRDVFVWEVDVSEVVRSSLGSARVGTDYVGLMVLGFSSSYQVIGMRLVYEDEETTVAGPTGPRGVQGDDGPAGDQGIQGEIGPTGDQGDQGEIGPTGDQGDQGDQGEIGPTGDQGVRGEVGPQGDQGEIGPQGIQGTQGEIGLTGAQGIQGEVGATGTQGETGLTGAQGIQGEVGATGAQGEIGLTGAQGIQGEVGATGTQGEIGLTGAQGIQGEVGATGAQGIQGETGVTGAQGTQGEIGPQGLQGETGLPGSQGIQGEVGATGAQGEIGLTGAQGIQGEVGATGAQGEIGLTGAQGIQGEMGATGAQGIQGEVGATGPQGDVGVSAYEVVVNSLTDDVAAGLGLALTASCPMSKTVLGGGCRADSLLMRLNTSYPASTTDWTCEWVNSLPSGLLEATVDAYAICASVEP